MPKYRVQLTDGRIVTLQADQPPTEEQILAQIGPRQTAPEPSPDGGLTATLAGGTLAASQAPGILSLVNKAATSVGPVAAKAVKSRTAPAAVAATVATQLGSGNVKGAAKTAGVAAAASQIPKALGIIAKATTPATGTLPSGATYALKQPGILARGAGALSKFAGAVGAPLTALSSVIEMQQYALKAAQDPNLPENERNAILGMLGPMIGGGAR